MAKKQTPTVKNFAIRIQQTDRNRKDLRRWKAALMSAEDVSNPRRDELYDLYEEMTIDAHLTSVMNKRRLALKTTTWQFVRNGEPDEDIRRRFINTPWFRQLLGHLIDAEFYGYSLVWFDLTWLTDRRTNHFPECEVVDRRHVVPELGVVIETSSDRVGIDYLDPQYAPWALPVGRKRDLGLILKAAPWVIMKKGNVSDWSVFNELFGIPMKVGTYDPNNPQTKTQLEDAFTKAGSASWLVVPEGSTIDVKGATGTGSVETFGGFSELCDNQISKLFLGNTMTSDVGSKGSLAQAQVHQEVEKAIAAADRQYVLDVLNQCVRQMLAMWGFEGTEAGEFTFVEEEATLTPDKRLEMMVSLHDKVAPVKRELFEERFDVEFDEVELARREAERAAMAQQTEEDGNGDRNQPEPKADKKEKGKKEEDKTQLARLYTTLKGFFSEAPH